MSSPPESSSDPATTHPGFIIQAKRGNLTEIISDAFTSIPSRLHRPRSESNSSLFDSSQALSKLISKITMKDIQGAKRIGQGGFGEIYVVECSTNVKVALKRLTGVQVADDLRRRVVREGDTWGRLKHPNVLPFLGVLETEVDLYLVSPYAKNGSLNDYIGLRPNAERRDLLSEAAAAIAFIHKNGIVHGDIKASNILVSDDIHALLCDFGLSRPDIGATSVGLQGTGTVRYQSPELFMEGRGKNFASDVWAFGMTIYEVLSGYIPFHQHTAYGAVFTAVVLNDERPPIDPSSSASGVSYDRLWRVAKRCWLKDPTDRPSMNDVHQCLRGVLQGHTDRAWCLAFSSDGTTIASGSRDRTLRLWDVASGSHRGGPLEGHTNAVSCLEFSLDGTIIASGSWDRTLRLWDVRSGSQRGEVLEGHTDCINCLAFSPNSTTIASGSRDHTLRLWNVASGSQMGTPLVGHTDGVWCLAFSPDGTTIVSGSSDLTLRLWDIASGGQMGTPLEGHTDALVCLAFSSDGTTIASGSRDSTIRLWNVSSGSQSGTMLKEHTHAVWCLTFSPDGTTLASGSLDFTIRLWDVASGSQRGKPLEGHTDAVWHLAFSSDGTSIASASLDTTIRLWDV